MLLQYTAGRPCIEFIVGPALPSWRWSWWQYVGCQVAHGLQLPLSGAPLLHSRLNAQVHGSPTKKDASWDASPAPFIYLQAMGKLGVERLGVQEEAVQCVNTTRSGTAVNPEFFYRVNAAPLTSATVAQSPLAPRTRSVLGREAVVNGHTTTECRGVQFPAPPSGHHVAPPPIPVAQGASY